MRIFLELQNKIAFCTGKNHVLNSSLLDSAILVNHKLLWDVFQNKHFLCY